MAFRASPNRSWGAPGRSRGAFEAPRATKVDRGGRPRGSRRRSGSIPGRPNLRNHSFSLVKHRISAKSTFPLRGRLGGDFGRPGSPFGAPGRSFWLPRALRGRPGALPGRPGALPGRSRGRPGSAFGAPWALLGAPGERLGTPGDPRALPEAILGGFLSIFGTIFWSVWVAICGAR